ncbi:MAG: V-type ATP synthase subunit F [Caldisericia bacterium]
MGKILYLGDKNFSIFLKSYSFDTISENIIDNFIKAYKNGDYTIIVVSEEYSSDILKVYDELEKKFLPIVIFLPSKGIKKEINYQYIKKLSEKAIGVDILEKGEKE